MARKSLIAKSLKKQKYSSREYSRCLLCGRARGYMRKFKMCRICFRINASSGNIPGITQSSW